MIARAESIYGNSNEVLEKKKNVNVSFSSPCGDPSFTDPNNLCAITANPPVLGESAGLIID